MLNRNLAGLFVTALAAIIAVRVGVDTTPAPQPAHVTAQSSVSTYASNTFGVSFAYDATRYQVIRIWPTDDSTLYLVHKGDNLNDINRRSTIGFSRLPGKSFSELVDAIIASQCDPERFPCSSTIKDPEQTNLAGLTYQKIHITSRFLSDAYAKDAPLHTTTQYVVNLQSTGNADALIITPGNTTEEYIQVDLAQLAQSVSTFQRDEPKGIARLVGSPTGN